MPTIINREDVQRLLKNGAQLLDVLPENDYEQDHLPGAINIPLPILGRDSVADLDRRRPVIVYCHDVLWDLSPRAAWRLETLGFTEVYDYFDGKADWAVGGLPREGKAARVIDIVRQDIPTCALGDRLGDISEKVSSTGKNVCVVLNDENIVLGRIRGKAFDGDPDMKVEDAMRSGPATIRPDTFVHDIVPRMHDRRVGSYIVTTALGRFVGILYRDDADRALDDQVKRGH